MGWTRCKARGFIVRVTEWGKFFWKFDVQISSMCFDDTTPGRLNPRQVEPQAA